MTKLLAFVSVGFMENGIAAGKEVKHVVDLTYSINSSTIYWPGSPEYNFTILNRGNVSNFWYETNYFCTAEHGGTHLDAPAHFLKDAWRNHEIPVNRLIGPGVVINVTSKAMLDPDYRVQISDLEAWESKYGEIPTGAIVLMKSGWSTKYPSKADVFNTNKTTDPLTFHFPGYHEVAVNWIIKHRKVNIIGLDTPSVDYGQTTSFPVHQLLSANNILGLENVAYLQNIPENGATIFVGVIKLTDGSGGPARVIATFSSEASASSCYLGHSDVWLTLFVSFLVLG